ncbi:MAG: hypothetical protein H6719_11825 [Sandaracinaceae bacterium]|nr:hypothetical protein [Sandaracinaceae bacterium]
MRVRVRSNWRTKLLLFLAFVAAGFIAWDRTQTRIAQQRAAAARAAESAPVSRDEAVVDVEIVAE